MAIFSRITAGLVLACIATTSLLAAPAEASKAIGARHLKHQQPRAHHFGKISKASKRADKKRACDAKNSPLTTTSQTSTSTSQAPAQTSPPPASNNNNNSGNNSSNNNNNNGGGNTGTGGGNGSPGGGKAGLGWLDGPQPYMQPFLATGKVTWCYTWSPWPCCSGDGCPESVPMLWGPKQLSDWTSDVYGKPQHILAFNEPDQAGQSDLSVGDAINLWWQYIETVPASRGSPAVTTSPAGIQWLVQFVNGCVGCHIDFLCIHFYGTKAQDFIDTVNSVHSQIPDKPIWVTEWACEDYSGANQQCDPATIASFMAETQGFLDSTPWIGRYAWFGALTNWQYAGTFNQQNGLIASDNSPSALGYQYIKW